MTAPGEGTLAVEAVAARARSRRRAGVAMIAISIIAFVATVSGAVTAWLVVGQFETTVDESLVLTQATLETLDDTIVLADAIVRSVDETLVALEASLGSAVASFDSAGRVLEDVSVLSEEVAPAVASATRSIRQLATTAATLDAFLVRLADVPFAPAYDPGTGLGARLDAVADDLEPVAAALVGAGTDLDDMVSELDGFARDLAQVRDAVGAVAGDVEGSIALLSQYRAATVEAGALTSDTRDDLGRDVGLTRVLIVFGALAAAQFSWVPMWLGRTLLGNDTVLPHTLVAEEARVASGEGDPPVTGTADRETVDRPPAVS